MNIFLYHNKKIDNIQYNLNIANQFYTFIVFLNPLQYLFLHCMQAYFRIYYLYQM